MTPSVPGASDLPAFIERIRDFRWIDLSHTLEEGMPSWPTHARSGRTLYESYALGDAARHYGLTMSERGLLWERVRSGIAATKARDRAPSANPATGCRMSLPLRWFVCRKMKGRPRTR